MRKPKELTTFPPEENTAQFPADQRENSRLMVIDRSIMDVIHIGTFADILNFIENSIVVINNTKVLPVRIYGSRPSGGVIEITFITSESSLVGNSKECHALLTPTHRLKPGVQISLPGNAGFTLLKRHAERGWVGEWRCSDDLDFTHWLEQYGTVPLPPYISRRSESLDVDRYQTIYAKVPGSLAAPTAGLHFTAKILEDLKVNNNEFVSVTLDVGLGTFLPIRSDDISEHKMHSENYSISPDAADKINEAMKINRRVTAVGTTSVRSLESAVVGNNCISSGSGVADIFIYPPYEFKVVDHMLTNFHRPDSTLIQLVAAFAGWELINRSYALAIEQDFRFYSYGDAMLIL